MPCRSDYLEVTAREEESRLVAGHLCYLFDALGQKSNITKEMKKAKGAYYGNLAEVDNWTALLCKTIRHMTDADKDKYIYDGKTPRRGLLLIGGKDTSSGTRNAKPKSKKKGDKRKLKHFQSNSRSCRLLSRKDCLQWLASKHLN